MATSSMTSLPPLSAVRVFEAAARHLNFTRAADELGMTQAAVSYQVKLLEDRLGLPLFHRLPRRLTLTEAGQQLGPLVSDALGRIAAGFDAVREDDGKLLSITSIHTFASNWLVPRLGRFQTRHPDIKVWLDTSLRMVDLIAENVDIAIRAGSGEWPGLIAERLMPIGLTPMASPALLESAGGVRVPADLLRLPLFREDDDSWERWFAQQGVDVAPGVARGSRLENQLLLGRGAASGMGVALLHPAFFTDELASGQLVQPFPAILRSQRAYFLAYPKARRHHPKVQAFRDWVMAEIDTEPEPVPAAEA
jgi:LysR family glycine cleavage system transcriptional activator